MEQLLAVMPQAAHLEACVILFSRILDLENHHPQRLLRLQDYAGICLEDFNTEGFDDRPHTDNTGYLRRLGIANTFNPFMPDRNRSLLSEGTYKFSCHTLSIRVDTFENCAAYDCVFI